MRKTAAQASKCRKNFKNGQNSLNLAIVAKNMVKMASNVRDLDRRALDGAGKNFKSSCLPSRRPACTSVVVRRAKLLHLVKAGEAGLQAGDLRGEKGDRNRPLTPGDRFHPADRPTAHGSQYGAEGGQATRTCRIEPGVGTVVAQSPEPQGRKRSNCSKAGDGGAPDVAEPGELEGPGTVDE